MKKLFFCAAALLAAISFSACSDDDETSLTASPDTIAGTWKIAHEEGWIIDDGEKETWSDDFPDENGWYFTITFDKNSFISTEYEGGDEIDREIGTYSISGNTLTLKKDYYSNESDKYEIRKLTESELVLLDIYEDWFEETLTLKRIK